MDALVRAADALHEKAAALNLAGDFSGAKAAYGEYAAALSACEAAGVDASLPDVAVRARLWAAAARAPRARRSVSLSAPAAARARAAVLGAAVADAAAMPTHWLYDVAALRARVGARDPAFCSPPANAFYSYELGRASPYGEQAAALLRSLAEAGSDGWSAEGYAARNFDAFASCFGGYRDASTRGFLRAARAGALPPATGVEDDQANAYARLPPLVAAFAGDAALLPAVRAMVRTTQRGALAVSCAVAAARLLEALILHGGAPAALGDAVRAAADAAGAEADGAAGAAALLAAAARAGAPHDDAVAAFGRNCHLPGSLSSAVHAVLAHGGDFAAAIRATIVAGGCNASRAGFIGACLAAVHGEDAIPPAWRAACAAYTATGELADALLGAPLAPPAPPAPGQGVAAAATTMRALRVLGPAPGDLQLLRVPRPGGPLRPLRAGEVAVRVLRVGVCGTDLEIVDGSMAYFASGAARYPVTLGHEWVGEVAAIGALDPAAPSHAPGGAGDGGGGGGGGGGSGGGGGLVLGDRVVGECSIGCRACASCSGGAYHRCAARRETGIMNLDGGAAEVVVLPVHALHRVSRALPLRLAALAEPTAVALNGVRLGGVGPGKLVAVIGDGPLGLLLLLVSLVSGADAVVVAGADGARLALAARLGAAAVVDIRACGDGDSGGIGTAAAAAAAVAAALHAAAGGRRPDVVLEASGAAAGVRAAVEAAAPGAVVVLQGLCGGGAGAGGVAVDTDRVVVYDLSLRGAVGSPGVWPAAIRLLESGRMDAAAALVTHELPLADFERAIALVRTRAAVKLLMLPQEGGEGGE